MSSNSWGGSWATSWAQSWFGATAAVIPPPVVSSGGPAGVGYDYVLAAILRLKRKKRKKDEQDLEIVKEALAAVVDDSEERALEVRITEAQSSLDQVERMVLTLKAKEAAIDRVERLWREIKAREADEDAVAILLMN